ncbi:hypothetical protein HK099_008676 [Clydaea vesicula]|uniref:Exportin-1/Importin-beta-like domain-containing protein n=1 Tax=Clydaea vesicula TaxID=447962 RepID=A0AAD5TXP7_9FUNG|nr:hypothetical protein HK099_008676 [Clydaea vesicula]
MDLVASHINTLYENYDPLKQKESQIFLDKWQHEKSSLSETLNYLTTNFISNPNLLFYAASTIQKNLQRSDTSLDHNQLILVEEVILTFLLSDIPLFVKIKFLTTLITLIITSKEPYSKEDIDKISMKLSQNLELKLRFFKLLPEEINHNIYILDPCKKARLNELLLSNIDAVLLLVNSVVFDMRSNDFDAQKLKLLSINVCLSWINLGLSTINSTKFMDFAVKSLQISADPEFFEQSAELFIELLPNMKLISSSVTENLLPVLCAEGAVKDIFNRSLASSNTEVLMIFTKLLGAFGDIAATTLIKNLHNSPLVQEFFVMVKLLTGYPGVFGVDEEFSDLTQGFWCNLASSFEELIEDDYENSPELLASVNIGKEIFLDLLKVIINKIIYPGTDYIKSNWSSDNFNQFRVYRRECADTILTCYEFLGSDKTLEFILKEFFSQFNKFSDAKNLENEEQFLILESSIFALKAVSESCNSNEKNFLSLFFGCNVFKLFKSIPVGFANRFKKTLLLVIGAYANWLNLNFQYLPECLEVLVFSLEVCDLCRENMKELADSLIEVLLKLTKDIKSDDKQKVIGGICSVISTLPVNEIPYFLMRILGDILEETKNTLNLADPAEANSKTKILEELRYLISCCNGISGDNEIIEIDDKKNIQKSKDLETIQSEANVSVVIWDVIKEIIRKYGTDEEIMTTLCSFMNTALISSMGFFSPPSLDELTLILITSFNVFGQSCFISTSTVLISYVKDEENLSIPEKEEKLLRLLQEVTICLSKHLDTKEKMEEGSDLICGYCAFLSKVKMKVY